MEKFMKNLTKEKEFIHSSCLLAVAFMTILLVFIMQSFFVRPLLLVPVFYFYFRNGLKFKIVLNLFFISLFFSFTFFVLGILYPTTRYLQGELITIFGGQFYLLALKQGLSNMFRLFLVSFISMASVYALSYEKVILWMLQSRMISTQVGYPILIALNAISLFKSEFQKMKMSLRLRGIKHFQFIYTLFPLLVFSVRQSQRGALSLITRGMNQNKTYYFDYSIKKNDMMLLVVMFIYIVGVCVLERMFQ